MEVHIQELSLLLCLRYTPSHNCMFPIQQMGIRSPRIHKTLRRDWTNDEKKRIRELLIILVGYTKCQKLNYYKYLMCNRIEPLLN
jgi:hypothetical protein